jgi:hypothetical protein
VIDIFIPVLGRPENAKKVVASIASTISIVDFSVIFICTAGDTANYDACLHTGARVLTVEGGRSEYPRKMNHAFARTDRKFCLLGADDIEFEAGWDYELLLMAEETKLGVIGSNDCANPSVMRGEFSTHPMVRRSYVVERGASNDGPGVLCHEGYDHNQVDVEICKLAQRRHEWAFAHKARICHKHPAFTGEERDATYDKGFRQFQRDRQTYAKRQKSFK